MTHTPEPRVTAKSSLPHPAGRTGPAYGWYLAAGVVSAAATGAGAWLYPGLPQSLPVHWNAAGQADGFAVKSLWSAFAVPLVSFGLVLFMLGTAVLSPRLAAWSGPTSTDPAAQTANLRATQFFLGAVTFSLSLLLAWIALRGWVLPAEGSTVGFLLPTLAFFLSMAGIGRAALRRYRREASGDGGGDGAPDAASATANPAADPAAVPADPAADPAADPGNYRAGIYLNRADPRVLVPKRIGLGWSVNAGRPAGLAFYLVIGLLAVGALVAGVALPLLAG